MLKYQGSPLHIRLLLLLIDGLGLALIFIIYLFYLFDLYPAHLVYSTTLIVVANCQEAEEWERGLFLFLYCLVCHVLKVSQGTLWNTAVK